MNLKKLVAILCSSVLLVGCSESVDDKKYGLDKDNPITLTLGTLEDTALQTAIDDFNSSVGEQRGINIEYVEVSSSDELSSMDMVSTDYNTIYSLSSSNSIAELSDYFTAMELGTTFFETSVEDVSLSGLRAIPTKIDINVLALDKTAWETFAQENGLDDTSLATWDGVLAVAETYQSTTNGESFLSIYSSYDASLEIASQMGSPLVEISSSGATINIQNDTMQTIWDSISVPQIKGLFVSGDYQTIEDGSTIATYCPVSKLPKGDDILVLQAPTVTEDTSSPYMVDTTAIAINSEDNSKIYAGVEFIKWLTDTNQNSVYALSDSSIPANKQFAPNSNSSLIDSYDVNATAIDLATTLLAKDKTFRVSPFDNISTFKDTLENKVNQTSSHDIVDKRRTSGVLEDKLYDGILDSTSFTTWYNDICEQLNITFQTES